MRQYVELHMANNEIIRGEVDSLPNRTDQFIILHNPKYADGSRPSYLVDGVKTVLVSWRHIVLLQLLPGADGDKPISFVRE